MGWLSRLRVVYGGVIDSKYYHYVQYLGFFVFTYVISWVCLDRSISEWLPDVGWIISDCEVVVDLGMLTLTWSDSIGSLTPLGIDSVGGIEW